MMLPQQRKQVILTHMSRQGVGSISELSKKLNVSEMTIRRDLNLLVREGFVERTHGGAILVRQLHSEPRFEDKENVQQDLKELIASYAVKNFVHHYDIIILEGGTTVTCMAKYLGDLSHLTVVTNGLNTLVALKKQLPSNSIICCGGMLREESHTFVGPITEQFLKQINSQCVFFSANGYTLEQGFTDFNMLEAQAKKAMSQAAKKKVMLLDSTKFGKYSFSTTFTVQDIDVLITDDGAPPSILEHFSSHGVDVHIVPKEEML
jgi:DeoR/GlpR family transcriptional regulator of sugar metabolism